VGARRKHTWKFDTKVIALPTPVGRKSSPSVLGGCQTIGTCGLEEKVYFYSCANKLEEGA
jgi:hypothetical protein